MKWKQLVFGLVVAAVMIGTVEIVFRMTGVSRAYSEKLQNDKVNPLKFAAVMARHRWEPEAGQTEHGELNLFPGKQIPDADLFWMSEPGSSYFPDRLPTAGRSERPADPPVEEKINRFGWRDDEVPETKSPGVFRVFCIGDSSTFGLGVYRDETYAQVLERLLNAAEPAVRTEVYNAGTPGYSSYQGRRLFETRILDLDPDAVTVMIGINDSAGKRNISDENYAKLVKPGRINDLREFLLSRSRIYVSVHRLVLWIKQTRKEQLVVPRVTLDQYRDNLSAIASECKARGIRLVIVNEAFRNQSSTDFFRSLDALAESLQVPLFDMTGALEIDLAVRQATDPEWTWEHYFTDPIHPSAAGHAVIADGLSGILEDSLKRQP